MTKGFTIVAIAAFLAATSIAAPNFAAAKSDKATKAAKSQTQECLKIADPKKKDECVSNAGNVQKRGKGVSTKADKAAGKAMDKGKAMGKGKK